MLSLNSFLNNKEAEKFIKFRGIKKKEKRTPSSQGGGKIYWKNCFFFEHKKKI